MKFALIMLLVATAAKAAPDPALVLQDPEILEVLEAQGLSLGARLLGSAPALGHNRELGERSAAFRDVVASVTEDLAELKNQDKNLGPSMAFPHRLFDARWLKSPAAHFELAAVINRLDRRPFLPSSCGELRFVYRLKYSELVKGQRISSRLPFTINLVSFQYGAPGGKGCQDVAKTWLEARDHKGKDLSAWLVSKNGPLSPQALAPERLKSLEVNLQSVRWPSTVRPDLGAHAEYLLRVFRYDQGGLALSPLENTPDVARLKKTPALRAKLHAWLGQPAQLAALDAGTLVVPDEFLALKATSVSPRGLTRLNNRPYSRLYTEADWRGAKTKGLASLTSPAAVLRRLDDLSCAGCHQGRSVAGFHLLGVDRADTATVNAVNVTGSPHLALDLPRRARFLEATAKGEEADPARPPS